MKDKNFKIINLVNKDENNLLNALVNIKESAHTGMVVIYYIERKFGNN